MRNRGRTKVTFQRTIAGDDGFGPNPAAGGWGDDIDIGVSLKPVRGKEDERNGTVSGSQTYEIEVRAHYILSGPLIDVTWRALVNGVPYNLTSVALNDSDYRFAKITITSGEPA